MDSGGGVGVASVVGVAGVAGVAGVVAWRAWWVWRAWRAWWRGAERICHYRVTRRDTTLLWIFSSPTARKKSRIGYMLTELYLHWFLVVVRGLFNPSMSR